MRTTTDGTVPRIPLGLGGCETSTAEGQMGIVSAGRIGESVERLNYRSLQVSDEQALKDFTGFV